MQQNIGKCLVMTAALQRLLVSLAMLIVTAAELEVLRQHSQEICGAKAYMMVHPCDAAAANAAVMRPWRLRLVAFLTPPSLAALPLHLHALLIRIVSNNAVTLLRQTETSQHF